MLVLDLVLSFHVHPFCVSCTSTFRAHSFFSLVAGIFVTMNPGYAGRKNLPDNLKQLFRSIAMVKPDRELIAQVMLFSQGFRTAEFLARKIVPLFELCADQLSHQSHYDFGLRALKSVLVSAGGMKRGVLMSSAPKKSGTTSIEDEESNILIRSVVDNVVPKLVADDLPLLRSLLMDVFPGREIPDNVDEVLETHLVQVCQENGFVQGDLWMEKMKQLHRIQVDLLAAGTCRASHLGGWSSI